ncbi:MAG: TPM domain-containing protein [Lachnospiraceae bacterium]|nr:TPM domain-containing protein [Lachnospiraceae bacterium]
MSRCPNCAADMRFDIASQQLVCDYCGTKMDPYEAAEGKEAKENDDFDVTIFTCPQCGGEIMTTDQAATDFCTYCGASLVLEGRMDKAKRPKKIIPFKKTKEDCLELYRKASRTAIFSPKEFRDPVFLDRFRGIYLPYWSYDFSQSGRVSLKGQRERGNYTEHLRLNCDLDGSYEGVAYDASSPFDDQIAEVIAPFNARTMQPFDPAFLSGFYADTADVDSELYRLDAEKHINEQTFKKIKRQYNGIHVTKPDDMSRSFHTELRDVQSAMYPVWFLTWRHKDRVAYAVVNGETGKMAADLPVDPKRYLLGSLLAAIPIFILLLMMPTIKASALMGISMILGFASLIIYFLNLYEMNRKEKRLDDKGFQFRLRLLNRRKGKKNDGEDPSGDDKTESGKKVLTALGFAGVNRFAFFQCGCTIASLVAAVLIFMADPVSDLYYYGGTILVLSSICITLLGLIGKYNLLATRPIPEFHNRGTGQTLGLVLLLMLAPLFSMKAQAAEISGMTGLYTNPETGYCVFINDEEDLLSANEEALLLKDMMPVTEYGHAVFVSASPSGQSSQSYANSTYWDISKDSSALFLIDMYNREIWMFSSGRIEERIAPYANDITDNIYRYASRGNYYSCASEAFYQAQVLLDGGRIAQPMKIISAVLLALILALMINYFIVRATSRNIKSTEARLMEAVAATAVVSAAAVTVTKRVRHEVSSGGGGGFSGGGFSGGGGGGGGFSGGGHKF